VTAEVVVQVKVFAPGNMAVTIRVHGVPYHGSGAGLVEAIGHLRQVMSRAGVPMPIAWSW
jgi:hypothetical protein